MKDIDEPERAFGKRARQMRLARDWSQEDVARRMRERGFSSWRQTTVAKSEAGDRPIRLNEAAALAHLFNGLIGEFIEEETRPEVIALQESIEIDARLTHVRAEAAKLIDLIHDLERESRAAHQRVAKIVPGFEDWREADVVDQEEA